MYYFLVQQEVDKSFLVYLLMVTIRNVLFARQSHSLHQSKNELFYLLFLLSLFRGFQ